MKPHAVCIPVPYQSHISAMLKFAKLLHSAGFHITFVNTDFTHRRILQSRGPQSLDGVPGFRFRTIPDGLPDPPDLESNKDGALMCEAMMNSMIVPFRDLIQDLVNNSSSSHQEEDNGEVIPPVSCIVTDGFVSFATDWAGEKLGIPVVSFFTVSACSLMGFRHFQALMDKGLIPLKDSSYLTNGYLDTTIDWIPGMNLIKLKELPAYLQTTDPENSRLKFGSRAPHRIHKASAVVIHTFDALETDVLDALSSIHPRVYAIGPLQLLLDKVGDDDDGLLASLESNLWKEDVECLRWLDSQEPDSVMYVNFGSVAQLREEQLIEFACGLADSDRRFLWALRPDMIKGSGAATTLLSEIVEETKGRGMVSAWCPQEQVLNHPAIAGFLTHCGWSSVLESLSAGVPMLCWPCLGDQTTNCKYICKEWEVGLKLDSNAKRDEVKRLVREVMARDNKIGMKLKEKAMHWKKLAHQATGPAGSSSTSFETMVNEILM